MTTLPTDIPPAVIDGGMAAAGLITGVLISKYVNHLPLYRLEQIAELAGRRAASIQSLLATAKLNDIEPAVWLKDTLEKFPAWPNKRIDELLPLGLTAE